MTNPAPLSVDPEQLGLAGGQLRFAAQLPTAPAPLMPAGRDPLSVATIGQIPLVDGPPMTELPLPQAQSTKTVGNVVDVAEAYSSTDEQLGGQIGKEMQNLPGAPGTGSGGPNSIGGQSDVGGQGDPAGGNTDNSGCVLPEAERAEAQKPEEREGAAAGQPGAERVPEVEKQDGNADGSPLASGRHRLPEPGLPEPSDDRITL